MGQVALKKSGGYGVLQILRPEALNALSREIVDEMDRLIGQIGADGDIRALVVYSEKNFAAGADIKGMVHCDEEGARAFSFTPTFNKLAALPIPTIAAIEGYALGGGLELALACDIRIAAENAKLGFPEINLGIMPGAGGTVRAPRLIGEAKAKELILTGASIDGRTAWEIGLVNQVVPPDALWETAEAMAQRLAKKSPIALAAAKETIEAGLRAESVEAGTAIEADRWAGLFGTEDQKEGMTAFIEKRKPVFQGR